MWIILICDGLEYTPKSSSYKGHAFEGMREANLDTSQPDRKGSVMAMEDSAKQNTRVRHPSADSPLYMTAVFKLRPTKRKAALLEKARSAAEDAFWRQLEVIRPEVEQISALPSKLDRKARLKELIDPKTLHRYGLRSPVRDGVARELRSQALSYVELKCGGHKPEWPKRKFREDTHESALDALARSVTLEEENSARYDVFRGSQKEYLRPLVLARCRECCLLRQSPTGALVARLDLVGKEHSKGRKTTIIPGIKADTGCVVNGMTSERFVLIPVEMSKWHEHTFLNGAHKLRSSEIVRDETSWFMYAKFEMNAQLKKSAPPTIEQEGVLGLDRGVCTSFAGAIVGMDGHVKELVGTPGSDLAQVIKDYEKRNRAHQMRKGRPRKGYKAAIDQILHEIVNEIIAIMKGYRVALALEKLDGLISAAQTKRKKGRRRSRWQKTWKTMQLRKLEEILRYKLRYNGLPPLLEVVPGGTSQTCSACGCRAAENRRSQAEFVCRDCGMSAHADYNAGVQIARRGAMILKKQIRKGTKLHALHMNMVKGLRSRDDAGLGPLPASAGEGFVAALDSARRVNDRTDLWFDLPLSGSENSIDDRQKQGLVPVFPEGGDPVSVQVGNRLHRIRCRWPRYGG
ncbi:zinc ribbon domain-containing protein [Shimia sp. W99]